MKFIIPKHVDYILNTFYNNSYEAYIVGGCIRDALIGKTPHDYDLCTNALPIDSYNLFIDKNIITTTGMKHGTIKIWIDDFEPVDITTYGLNPRYVKDAELNTIINKRILYDDLARRDFTMNAMAISRKQGLIDYFNGVDDIKYKRIIFVDEPKISIKRDKQLILRAFRQSMDLNFHIESANFNNKSIKVITDYNNSKELLTDVSGWKKGSELFKIMSINFKERDDFVHNYLLLFLNHTFPYLYTRNPYSIEVTYGKIYRQIINNNNTYFRLALLFSNLNIEDLVFTLTEEFEYSEEIIQNVLKEYERIKDLV